MPEVLVRIPAVLARYAGGGRDLPVEAGTVGEALAALARTWPELHRCLCDETGRVRRHINLFVNVNHVRDREGLETGLRPGDVLFVLPAVSGG